MRFLSTKQIILCSLFAALTAICAAISIPLGFTPAPITLQVFAVFLTASWVAISLAQLVCALSRAAHCKKYSQNCFVSRALALLSLTGKVAEFSFCLPSFLFL